MTITPENEIAARGERPEGISSAEEAMRRHFNQRLAPKGQQEIWRWRLLPGVLKQTIKYRESRREAGMTLPQLFRAAWDTCTREECWPGGYFKFKLYRTDRQRVASRFIHERIGLAVIKDLNDAEDVAILDDKVRFAAACERFGLPHVETIAYFENGTVADGRARLPDDLPREDLFVKSTNLLCGRGVQRWRYDPRADLYCNGSEKLGRANFFEQIRLRSMAGIRPPAWKRVRSHIPRLGYEMDREEWQARPYLVQSELRNHPDVERFTNGALCTVRVVTARQAGGEPEAIIAALRMPVGASSVDNFAAGGLASPIDLESGRLGTAVYKDPRKPDCNTHPDSGRRIAGESVPSWPELVALCLRAHRCFPRVASVGWDVAITTEGLKLIEANPGWCVEVVQMAHGKPLGETRLPELLMSHVDNERRPPDRSFVSAATHEPPEPAGNLQKSAGRPEAVEHPMRSDV